ncbi:APC family permease [Mesoplasma lactucae]|uniref:Uncharacterized protein n=1 Tax=Mesoplasma lactucae ATCC 49193 TaxID=81460 RepID=A0A291IRH4_9MOLU|nr:APC family permease [Mesoplasma lactucae]ATG97326.1 hypothetical protein CP520_00955 [Mesoplasma lactucae ATCC 49193]ATZ20223.1 hypothetical protein MLACT_v1c04020 [Mesoplasma lactucae ATCC 49193]MCL8216972.1 hypothetical protein [Mesoplasma lactucae ATCC 49193]
MAKKLTSKKSLEFLTIMTTVVGTMVGAGIYVKNDNHNGHVLGQIQNPYVALILWAVTGVIVMAAIMIFLEVASATAKKGNGTVANWIRLFLNTKTARLASIYYIFVYLPVNYGFFATLVIQYVLTAAGNPITNKGVMIALYLSIGTVFIVGFSSINAFARKTGKSIQIVGTIVKFLPLILVLIAIFVPDKSWGVIFNKSGMVVDENGKQLGNLWNTSFEDVTGTKVMSGFTPILFAFNGFIYAANMQAEVENKDAVAKGILAGVIFTTIFYILISLSLFLGSADGSVVSFFNYMFNGFKTVPKEVMIDGKLTNVPMIPTHGASIIASNIILSVVCLLGLNSYTLTGTNFYNTDANAGIVFSDNKYIKQGQSGMIQMGIGLFFFYVLATIAILIGKPASYLMDLTGNAGAIIGFSFYTLLIFLAMRNRFTKKVEVDRINKYVFWFCGPFSFISLLGICIYSYLDFFGAFGNFKLENVLAMAGSVVVILILWVINEICFKKVPFDAKSMEEQKEKINEKLH